jgi:hypothetical protein
VLYENNSTKRIDESLELFKEMFYNRFINPPIFLVFTKIDIFKNKIKIVNFNSYFNDSLGGKGLLIT